MIDVSVLNTYLSLENFSNFIWPLLIFIVGMVVYSIFIFKMYRTIASRDVFTGSADERKESKGERGFFDLFLEILEYVLFFPLVSFFFFLFFFVLLLFLSKTSDINTLMLISMALVGSVRVSSYISEDLSKDLSKMLPFALLGIFLVDISYFSFWDSYAVLINALLSSSFWFVLAYYLLFAILLEMILRLVHYLFSNIRSLFS